MHTHDGFYLRMSLGAGWGQVKSEGSEFEVTSKGGGWLMDLLLGGTVANMVTIGGGFLIHEISNPEVEANTNEFGVVSGDGDPIAIVNFGPFVDIFFDPKGGGHVGTMFGGASIGLEGDGEDAVSSGWGWAIFGGYDHWVSDNWAIGVNARYMYVKGKRELDNFDDSGFAVDRFDITDTSHTIGVMFSALYH